MNDVEVTTIPNDVGSASANILSVTGDLDPTHSQTFLRMEDGQVIRLNTAVLMQAIAESDFSYELESANPGDESEIVIPLVEERLAISRREVATGIVRLQKTTQEYTREVDEILAIRTFDVERIVLNQPVEIAPPVRQEGNVTIYSLVEEQLVLTKQLVLKEEVRVSQRDTERRDTRVVTLHKEHLTVERESQPEHAS